jgi:hypothetical protein
MEIFKIFGKFYVWNMPIILKHDKFNLLNNYVNFKNLEFIKIGRFFIKYNLITSLC